MSSPVVPVAVAQFAPGEDRDRNLKVIRSLASSAADRGARLVVFPEYSSFFVDPVGAPFLEAAEPLDGPFVEALTRLAGELNVHIVAGMAEHVASGSRFFNTVVAVAPEDGVVATYRKQHLYDAFGGRESDWVEPGPIEPAALFEIDGLRIGLQTCYDLRFPEVTRRIVDAGAELVLVPSEWVRGPLKEQHWRTLLAARAIEDTVFVAAADHTPPVGVGTSLILDPMGVALADAGMTEGVALAWLDRSHLADVRGVNPALRLRRYRVVPRD
jgi:predicted amidohydrolase